MKRRRQNAGRICQPPEHQSALTTSCPTSRYIRPGISPRPQSLSGTVLQRPLLPYRPHRIDCLQSPLLQHGGCVSLGGQHNVPTAGQRRAGLPPPLGQGGVQRRRTAFSNCNKEFSHPLFNALSFSIVRQGLGNRARFPPLFLGAVFRELIQSAHRLNPLSNTLSCVAPGVLGSPLCHLHEDP